MKKAFKIILYSFLSIILLLSITALYAYKNIDALKQYALVQLNQQLKAKITATDIDVTFYHTFPKISLQFKNLDIRDYLNKSNSLLKAKSAYLGFDILQIIKKNYVIETIQLDSGILAIHILKNGKENFDIILSEPSTKKTAFNLNLKKVLLNNMQCSFLDEKNLQEASLNISKGIFGGNFSDDWFNLSIELNALINNFKSNHKSFVSNKQLSLKTEVLVNSVKQTVTIKNTKIALNKLAITLNGKLFTSKNVNNIDLEFNTSETTIQELISLLPVNIPDEFYKYKSTGNVYFKGKVNGVASNPSILVDFGVNNGTLTEPTTNLSLSNINFKGNFTNGKQRKLQTTVLTLTDIKANIGGKELQAYCKISNFFNPNIDLKAIGNLDANFLVSFFKFTDIEMVSGNVNFNISASGAIDQKLISAKESYGTISFKLDKLKIKNVNSPFNNIVANLQLTNQATSLSLLNFNYHKSNYQIIGSTQSLYTILFEPNLNLNADLEVKTNLLDIKDWYFSGNASKKDANAKSLNYNINLNITADALVFEKFNATKATASVKIKNQNIEFNNLSLKSCDGSIVANGLFYEKNNNYFLTTNNAKLSQINIRKLFTAFDNFGQKEIIDQNLNGSLTSTIDFICVWDNNFNVLTDKIYLYSTIKILNGELINYKPLQALSKFVNLNNLKNLKFSELKNTIEIKNEVITIPQMDILNNAINITFSGTHNFNNIVDYRVKLNLNEILKKGRTDKENEFGEIDEKGKGINLFLNMTGPLDNLKIAYDKKAVQAKLKEDIKIERRNIGDIIKQELGIGKKDSSLKKLEKKNNTDELEFEN